MSIVPATADVTANERETVACVLTEGQTADYLAMRDRGTSHNLALICLTRHAPGIRCPDKRLRLTDSSSMLGRKALRTGQYMDALARPEVVKRLGSDPGAYVDSRREAERRATELGLEIVDRADIESAMDADERKHLGQD